MPVAPRDSLTLAVIDSVFAPTTCRAVIDEADSDRWLTTTAEIGAVAAIEVDADGLMTAVAEPVRRGGGTGLVVDPTD